MYGSEVTRAAFSADQTEALISRRLFLGSAVFTLPVLIIMFLMGNIPATHERLMSGASRPPHGPPLPSPPRGSTPTRGS